MNQVPGDYPIELVIKAQDVNLVLQGLGQLPYYVVTQLINQIQTQTDVQAMQYLNSKLSAESTPKPPDSEPSA